MALKCLKAEIDDGTARVISAPHKTPGGDSRLHMTVHCKTMMATYHVYISTFDLRLRPRDQQIHEALDSHPTNFG